MPKKWPEILVIIVTLLLIAVVIHLFDRKAKNLQNKTTAPVSAIKPLN